MGPKYIETSLHINVYSTPWILIFLNHEFSPIPCQQILPLLYLQEPLDSYSKLRNTELVGHSRPQHALGVNIVIVSKFQYGWPSMVAC